MRVEACTPGCLVAFLVASMQPARAEQTCMLEPTMLQFDDEYRCSRESENHESLPGYINFISFSLDESRHA